MSTVSPSMYNVHANTQPDVIGLSHRTGDIFAKALSGTLLLHSCNTLGAWGKGIAIQFRSRYPDAYEQYKHFCKENAGRDILGTCLLTGPHVVAGEDADVVTTIHYVGCLFVRKGYGKPTAKERAAGYEDTVLKHTAGAFEDLFETIQAQIAKGEMRQDAIREIRMPRINAGFFGVPWEETERVLREVELPKGLSGVLGTIYVCERLGIVGEAV